ncbi:MAG: hypothetical protein KC563_08740 [Nitrospira sp.]|nr:hypothetical protein [Nitrospira sp.]MCA9475874.1 hypothetical protein [Nitrospira sp.]MCB9710535.1 hypothetical protein [Nitrospiraceae bacterium]MDR4488461.1 hypothetical protein [Nitrospirales bacterium]HQU28229.1 hypothetical protein [Nitrospirales bacterium]
MNIPIHSSESPFIEEGLCFVMFAFDVGASIRLDEAERHITATKERSRLKRQRPAPQYFDYNPPPLRITQDHRTIAVEAFQTLPQIETILYDFGAMMVMYRIPLRGPLRSLLRLSESLYDHAQLLPHTQQHVSQLIHALGTAIEKANCAPFVEDYNIFSLSKIHPAVSPGQLLEQERELIAKILRAEDASLSTQEVTDATASSIAYGQQDLTLIDWNAAMVIGQEMDDVRAVLEIINIELVERRFLDHQLDDALEEAYATLTSHTWYATQWPGSTASYLRRIAGLQVDSAILFERVTNTLKLFSDQYLARVNRLASQRFYLSSWDISIRRKLDTLDNLYDKMADHAGNRRMEILEWIIIILIAISILLPFIPGFPGY